jgi:heme/copper-type cytochrome/quinol oxidase subunit 2
MLKPIVIISAITALNTWSNPAGIAQNSLRTTLLWSATLILVITAGLLVAALLGLIKRTNQDPVNKSSATLDTVWTIIPVVLLIVILLLTFQAVFWRGI